MSLRLNLYGCDLSAVYDAIGSRSSSLFDDAVSVVAESLTDETHAQKARNWIELLLMDGHSLRADRNEPEVPLSGDLLTTKQESEIHIVAFHALVTAVCKSNWLDLTNESSHWHHSAIVQLYNEFVESKFTRSDDCPITVFQWFDALIHGTPQFGDQFQTKWSYYSVLDRTQLSEYALTLTKAIKHYRKLPNGMPDSVLAGLTVELSNDGKTFASELSAWLRKIADENSDMYIIWW